MSATIRPGTLAIFSDCDAPCPRMVAVVTMVRNGRAWGRYLSDAPRKMCDPQGRIEDWTPVDDFGVTIHIDLDQGLIASEEVGRSAATYRDGAPRAWQRSKSEPYGRIKLKKTEYWARWALNKQILSSNLKEMGACIKERVAARRAQ